MDGDVEDMSNVDFVEAFSRNFEPYKGKKMALYGLGENTKLLLDSLQGFNIVALMDRQETGNVKWGKRVISIKELEALGVEVVVIVARACFIKLIYGRIAVFCQQHGIEVFEVRGRRLDCRDDLKSGLYADNAVGRGVTVKNDYEMGYKILGPIMSRFMLFTIKEVQKSPDGVILFGSRDGYIFKEMYKFYSSFYRKGRKGPKGEYVYTSRISCVAAGLISEEDILYALRFPFSGTIEELMEQRFFMKKDELLPRENGLTDVQYVLLHKERIIRGSMRQREYYKRYLSQNVTIQGKLYFVDFWASGTCQLYLEQILGCKLQGVYLRHIRTGDSYKDKLEITSMYPVEWNENNLYHLDEVYILLEGIITSPEPTVKCFDSDGRPVFYKEERTQEEISLVQQIQQGILDYFKDYVTAGGALELCDLGQTDSLLGLLYNSELVNSIYLQNYIVEDEFVNRKFNVNEFI